MVRRRLEAFLSVICLLLLAGSAAPRSDGERPDAAGRGVDLTAVVEHADLDYQFSSTIGTFTLEHGETRIILVAGSRELYIGDRVILLSRPVRVEGQTVMVPPDAVDRILEIIHGEKVSWQYDGGSLTLQNERGSRSGWSPSNPRNGRSRYEIGTIVLDAGHGGEDPGGVGVGGIREKDIVLPVTREVEKELARRLRRTRVVMTRQEDEFASLEKRGEIANSAKPQENLVFVSIHANVSFSTHTRGYETYFLSIDPFGERARDVASMENSVLSFEIENHNEYLKEVINRIVDIQYRRESMMLAGFIQDGLRGALGPSSSDRGVKSAFFFVLKEAKMPAVLIEIGFITNRDESGKLVNREYQRKIARGIADGIESFVTSFRQTEGFTK
jgi:N-acetylmuramoyl-L-alanine amidase